MKSRFRGMAPAIDELEPLGNSVDGASGPDPELTLSAFVAELDEVTEPDADTAPESGRCRCCGLEGRGYAVGDVFSNAFTSASSLSPGDHVCYRCEYLATEMDYRRYHWIATEDGIETTKERPVVLDTLLDPPEGRWMVHITDGFLFVRNSWLLGMPLNVSRESYAVIDDTVRRNIDREEFSEMVDVAREYRQRDDQVAKRVLTGGVTAADYDRYGLTRADADRIDEYRGRSGWDLVVQLIQ
jgi:hypothetical protein